MSERKDRVTLEVTHSDSDRLGAASSWEWQTMADATIGQDAERPVEVRVVQEGRLTDAEVEALRRVLRLWREDYYGRLPYAEQTGAVIDGLLACAAKERQ